MGQTRAPSPATTDLQAVSQAESSMSGVTRCLICSITWWTSLGKEKVYDKSAIWFQRPSQDVFNNNAYIFFLLAYFICLDMLLLLLLFKFSLFVSLFVFGFVFFGFFVLQIWFVNTYRLSAISYQCPMGHRKPRGVSKGERLRLSWFLYWKKTTNFVVHDITFLTIDFNRTFFQNRTKINCNIVPLHCW